MLTCSSFLHPLVHVTTVTIFGNFIQSSLENCCNANYSWKFDTCMVLGGADIAAYSTNEFYVDYISESCKQSCKQGTAGLNCAGLAPNWITTYATAALCCNAKLWWTESSKCIAESTLTPAATPAGSGNWYRKGEKVCMVLFHFI